MSQTDSGSLSRQEQEEYRRLETDPVYFYKKMFATPEEPDFLPYQKKVACDVMNPEYEQFAVLKGRQIGMSWVSGSIVNQFAMMNAGKTVLLVSFHLEQAQIILDYAKTFLSRLKEKGWYDMFVEGMSARDIRFTNGSKVKAFGCTVPDAYNIRGQIAHFLVVDEAAFIYDRMFPSITPTTSNTKGKMLFLSTAGSVGSYFYRLWDDGNRANRLRDQAKKGYDIGMDPLKIPKLIAYTIPSTECERLGSETLESEKRKLGEMKFNREYLCMWAGTAEQVFIKIPTFSTRKLVLSSVKPCYGGIDVGKINDPTVLAIVEQTNAPMPVAVDGIIKEVMVPFRVAYLKSWERETGPNIARDIAVNINPRFNPRLYEIDATGGYAAELLTGMVNAQLPCKGMDVKTRSKNDLMLGSPAVKGLNDAFAEDLLWINNDISDTPSLELLFELNAYTGKLTANGLYTFDSVVDRDHMVDAVAHAWSAAQAGAFKPFLSIRKHKT